MQLKKLQSLKLSALAVLMTGCSNPEVFYEPTSAMIVDETYVHRYGVPVTPQDWSDSGNHGQIVTTLSSGVVVTKSYDSGILEGETTYSYPHSSAIEKKDTYANGVLQKQASYYMSGAPKQEIVSNSPQNKVATSWYESGAAKSKEEIRGNLLYNGTYYGENNQVEGEVVNYNGTRIARDEYGQIVSKDSIQNGLLQEKTTYHPNGSPKEIYPYQNSQINGTVRTFYPAGEPKTIEEWTNGARHGVSAEYVNGEKVADVQYVNGSKHGVEQKYRDGEVVHVANWENDNKHGAATSYLGNNPQTVYYHQNAAVSKSSFDQLNNQPAKKSIWNQAQ